MVLRLAFSVSALTVSTTENNKHFCIFHDCFAVLGVVEVWAVITC